MGLNRQEKADMIKEISEIIAGTEGLVIAEYRGRKALPRQLPLSNCIP